MFPRISDLANYLFGTNLKIPIQTYGFFLALAFIAGAWIIYLELKRKEKEGSIHAQQKKILKGAPASISELILSAVFGFILGWKGIGMILFYEAFSDNPQEYILSSQGSFTGGLALAIFFGTLSWFSKKRRQLKKPVWEEVEVHPFQLTGNIILIAAIFGIIGSKIFDTIEHIQDLFSDPIGTLISFSGLSFYGGFIVAAFAVVYYAHKNKIRFPYIADVVSPALILSYAIGRTGCQLAGDGCWGAINASPKPQWMSFLPDWMWAFKYPHNVINDGILIPNCSGSHCYMLPFPAYPTPFYEALLGLMIFGILWLIRKKLTVPGYLFCIYLILNGLERLLIEQIRINKLYHVLGMNLTQAEIIAIILIILGISGFFYFKRTMVITPDG